MLPSPIWDAMHTARLKVPPSILSGKISKPTLASQCYHASPIHTIVSPVISFRNCCPIQRNILTPMLQSRRAESTFAAGSSTTPASTTTAVSPTESSSAATPPAAAAPRPTSTNAQTLTWNRFLELRASRGRYNTIVSACTAVGSGFAGVIFLAQQDLEKVGNMFFGMDPIFALGAATFASAAVGWLLGPFAGNAVFGLWYRRLRVDMTLKEKQFYQRIKRYRADPSSQSMANPIPDYYGEKISSVQDYRRWLKDQRAFTRKRQSY